jgi:hypothetical protein
MMQLDIGADEVSDRSSQTVMGDGIAPGFGVSMEIMERD